MASKTVWVVGGIVVVLGAVLYVTMKEGPASTSATGTIVEAKRARADGTNSFNPTPTASTTDQSSDAAKGMAGPDAAKDAATAASGDSGNARSYDFGQSKKMAQDQGRAAQDAAAAKAAAEAAAGSGDNLRKAAPKVADAKAADEAARGVGANLRGGASMRGGASAATGMSSEAAKAGADKAGADK